MTASAIPVPELTAGPPADAIPRPEPTPDAEPKKSHKRKVEAPPEAPPGPSPEDVASAQAAMAVTFKAAGILAAGKWGEHWKLADEEQAALGNAWGTAVAPYLSKIGPATPFLMALIVTAQVVYPRVVLTKARQASPLKSGGEEAAEAAPPPVMAVPQAEPPRSRQGWER